MERHSSSNDTASMRPGDLPGEVQPRASISLKYDRGSSAGLQNLSLPDIAPDTDVGHVTVLNGGVMGYNEDEYNFYLLFITRDRKLAINKGAVWFSEDDYTGFGPSTIFPFSKLAVATVDNSTMFHMTAY